MEDKIRVLLSEEEVDKRIEELGRQISRDYEGRSVHLICVLKGGVFFTCELAKRITVPVSLDFMSVSSYGADTKSSGVVKIVKDLDEPLEGKDVLIVEDIIDSGRTLSYLIEILHKRHPASISLCTLAVDISNILHVLRRTVLLPFQESKGGSSTYCVDGYRGTARNSRVQGAAVFGSQIC